jgi:hypothetical protein
MHLPTPITAASGEMTDIKRLILVVALSYPPTYLYSELALSCQGCQITLYEIGTNIVYDTQPSKFEF